MKHKVEMTMGNLEDLIQIGGAKAHPAGLRIITEWNDRTHDRMIDVCNHFNVPVENLGTVKQHIIDEYVDDSGERTFELEYSLSASRIKAINDIGLSRLIHNYKCFKETVCDYQQSLCRSIEGVRHYLPILPKHQVNKRLVCGVSNTQVSIDDETMGAAIRAGGGNLSKGLRVCLEWSVDKECINVFKGLKNRRCVGLTITTIEQAISLGDGNKSLGARRAVWSYVQAHNN